MKLEKLMKIVVVQWDKTYIGTAADFRNKRIHVVTEVGSSGSNGNLNSGYGIEATWIEAGYLKVLP